MESAPPPRGGGALVCGLAGTGLVPVRWPGRGCRAGGAVPAGGRAGDNEWGWVGPWVVKAGGGGAALGCQGRGRAGGVRAQGEGEGRAGQAAGRLARVWRSLPRARCSRDITVPSGVPIRSATSR